jgi:putative NIF3 family GTP cyclohydrolase 1 type 2
MSLLKDVLKANADLYITGDTKYHEALNAFEANINIIDIGHFYSEFIFTELMKDILKNFFNGHILIYNQQDIFKYN